MVRPAQDEIKARGAKEQAGRAEKENEVVSCFDFGCACFVCGKGDWCDYCLKIAGYEIKEEQLEMF